MKLLRLLTCVLLVSGLAAPMALADVTYQFDVDDGGFSVADYGNVEDPWLYDSGQGTWSVGGSASVGLPTAAGLWTETYELTADGPLALTFDHRYSIEFGGTRWDGAALMYRVNDGGFHYVDGSKFTAEGYIDVIVGNNALNGLEGFNDLSDGYLDGNFITSIVQLGNFSAGDKVQVEFLGAWDEFSRGSPDGTVPNWEIDSVSVTGQFNVVPSLPAPPLFVGGEAVIGQDTYTGTRSNAVFGAVEAGVPGFVGRIVTYDEHQTTLNDHTTAELVLADYDGETAMGTYPVVDFAGDAGMFTQNLPYPNGVNDASQDDFAVQVTADVVIPAGSWAIAFGSDDGGQVTIPGITLLEYTNDHFEDDQIRFEANRSFGWTIGTFELTEDLATSLIGSFHERGGGDSFEIAVLDASLLETPNADNGWKLLGDGVFGWSVVSTAEPLLSADLTASLTSGETYRFDINGDTNEFDQVVVDNPDPAVYTSMLDVQGTTFQIKSVGTVASGTAFQIIDANVIVGTPTIISSDPSQTWVFDTATGQVCLDSCSGALLGDFNGDGAVSVADLDVMKLGDAAYDVTGDGVADALDLTEMVSNLIGTWIGDSNGDGEFGSSDFVQIFTIGKFETGEAAVWSEGDWNLDGVFNTSDFVAAFTEGGFELGPKPAVPASVPEPSSLLILVTGLPGLFLRRR